MPVFADSPSDRKPLFDGKGLNGWAHVGPGRFVVEDGQLRTEGGIGLICFSREKLGDSVIRIVYKTGTASSDSGISIRIADKPSDPRSAVHHGFEVQSADGGKSARGTGLITTFADLRSRPGKPLDGNTLEVTLKKNRMSTAITELQSPNPMPTI